MLFLLHITLFITTISLTTILNGVVSAKSLTNCTCGRVFGDNSISLRVVGGTVIAEKNHPTLALLLVNNIFNCGGSVVSSRHVLTAAHCVPDKFAIDQYKVVLGVHDRIRQESSHLRAYPIQEIIKHKGFKKLENGMLINDIALLLVPIIEFSDYIKPICLPFSIDTGKFKSAVVEGWGTTRHGGFTTRYPRQAVLSLLTIQQCQKTEMHSALDSVDNIDSMVLCAYKANTDACQGDSGGPLFVMNDNGTAFQIGIVSFGVGCGNDDGYPGLYTRLSNYLGWLQQELQGSICYPPP